MKLITVDDFLTWHNNAGGFLSCPVIVQLDNDPPHERELSLYFFSCLEGGAKNGMYGYWVRNAARKQDLDLSKMIVVGFREPLASGPPGQPHRHLRFKAFKAKFTPLSFTRSFLPRPRCTVSGTSNTQLLQLKPVSHPFPFLTFCIRLSANSTGSNSKLPS